MSAALGRRARRVLYVVLALTGAGSLVLQVAWQRTIALHAGVDLSSSTAVVVAFLLGLGIGSAASGAVADRLDARTALRALAAVFAAVAALGLISVAVLDEVYRALAQDLDGPASRLVLDVAILLVPTLLQGATLPLAARATTARVGDAGARVGRLQAANTLGAAAGAAIGGWVLLGLVGFAGSARIAAVGYGAAAVTVAVLAGRVPPVPGVPSAGAAVPPPRFTAAQWGWCGLYGITGGIALGLEQVDFRLVDGVLRANSYTFGHVLAIYLTLLAVGAAAGSALVRRARDPRRWFLGLQGAAGITALAALGALVAMADVAPLAGWFDGDGFVGGFSGDDVPELFGYALVLPTLVMAGPVVLAGASFPFVQAVVARDVRHVGRATGRLLAANLAGNVAGALLTTFVLVERWGTAGALVALALPLSALAVVAAATGPRGPRTAVATVAVVAAVAASVAALPSNTEMWAAVNGTSPDGLHLAEDRSCASALVVRDGGGLRLTLNASSQNDHPYDDFHVVIGLLPALAHPDPRSALAIGLGIGSTSYGLLAAERVERVTTVELCGGNAELLRRLAGDVPEFRRVVEDPRHEMVVGDGRRTLVADDRTWDVVVPDTMRPSTAGSGNIYSLEMMQLVRDRMPADGILSIWVPTERVLAAAAATFPHVSTIEVESYQSTFLLASMSPLPLDEDTLVERFDAVGDAFEPVRRDELRALLSDLDPRCITDGEVLDVTDAAALNRDLRPRDEYILTNDLVPEGSLVSGCGG